jgi:glutathione peroxidase|tara:strand:- start:427 stop:906 length:480 start_codon:yes stop_codon:yes gene_type:complete
MNVYDLKINKPSGEPIDFSQFKNKTLLFVNTATKCGLTPQFDGLEKLHQQYKDQGLIVIGFPCNQFLSQEPETNDTIVEACRINHGVTFPLTEKIKVNGSDSHPVFKYLKDEMPGTFTKSIKWNFTKFIIDKNGKPFKRYAPKIVPSAIEADIKELINQ